MERHTNLNQQPHQLARWHEAEIKAAIMAKYETSSEELTLLLDEEAGVYWSREEPNTLCCFVLGEADGYLYLVAATIEEGGARLGDFKSDIIA